MKKQILITIFVLIFLTNIFLVSAQVTQKTFSEDEIKSLYLSVNRYDVPIKKYIEKFNDPANPIPVNLAKAIIAIESEGILNQRTTDFNSAGAIGLMQIVPFYTNGTSLHYKTCLNIGCMSTEVEESDSLEVKQDKIRIEYANADNSICCGIRILKDYYSTESKSYDTSSCNINLPTKSYSGWLRASKSYNGFGCPPDAVHAYYAEYVDQLWKGFDQISGISTSKYGAIRFTPTFSIKAPELYFDIYPKLNNMIKEIVSSCKLDNCVKNKLNSFEQSNNMNFKFCEEPEVNLINYFYDNLVNAIESNAQNCLYPVTGQGNPFSLQIKPQEWIFNNLLGDLNLKNNLSSHLYREFHINTPSNFNLVAYTITAKYDNSYFINYEISDFVSAPNKKLKDINKIYFLKNHLGFSNFIFQKSDGTYYDANGDSIDIIELGLTECDTNIDFYKVKYFDCLDTNKKEQIFDWTTQSWKDSEDTIKIKFAFALDTN